MSIRVVLGVLAGFAFAYLSFPFEKTIFVGIRPDDRSLDTGSARIGMVPEIIERLGSQSVVHGWTKKEGPICAVIGGPSFIAEGQHTELAFDGARAHLFHEDGSALARRIDLTRPEIAG